MSSLVAQCLLSRVLLVLLFDLPLVFFLRYLSPQGKTGAAHHLTSLADDQAFLRAWVLQFYYEFARIEQTVLDYFY
jgi:hypothetical protein